MSNWSASRVGCFVECPLKYKLNYVEHWKSTAPVNTALADKGSAFHETAEKFHTGMSEEDFWKILNERIEHYKVNVTDPQKDFYFDYRPAVAKFFAFWNKLIAPKEADGWKISQEGKVKNTINNEPFIGYLDLCLEKDDEIIIYDYKTGSSINAASYKPQQILYAYMKGLEKGWTIEKTTSCVKLFIFGPLIKDLENKTVEQNMMRGVKEIKYTVDEMKSLINDYYMGNINAIHTMNWSRAKANMTHSCSWCPYCGSSPNDKGFSGCPATVKAGFMTPDGVKFIN